MYRSVDITSGYAPSLDAASQRTSYLVNWRLDGSGTNVPRPPLVAQSMTGMNSSTTVSGLYVFKDRLIIVGSDRYIYRVEYGTPTVAIPISTSTGTTQLAGTSAPIFAEDASDLFIVGGGAIQKWTPGDPVTARLANTPGGPSLSTHIAWLGQRLVANNRTSALERSYYYWSDAGDGSDTSWPAAAYASAESDPDEVLAIYSNADWLWVFGATTLQTFGIGSDANNPFDSISTVRVGLGAIYSPIKYDGAMALIDETGRIIRTDGRSQTPQEIGGDIVTDIRSMSTYADAWGWRMRQGRYDVLGYSFPTAGRTFELDLHSRKWSEQAYYDPAQGLMQKMPIQGYAYWQRLGLHVFGRSDTNDIATVSEATGLELGGELMCRRTVSNVDHGIHGRKASDGVWACIRRGTSTATVPGVVEVRVRNDGLAWSNWKQKSVGIAGDADQRAAFYFGGIFYKRDYDIRYAGSDATSIVSIQDDIVEVDR